MEKQARCNHCGFDKFEVFYTDKDSYHMKCAHCYHKILRPTDMMYN